MPRFLRNPSAGAGLAGPDQLQPVLHVAELRVCRAQVRRNRHHTVALPTASASAFASSRMSRALRGDLADNRDCERQHHERQEQADFVLSRKLHRPSSAISASTRMPRINCTNHDCIPLRSNRKSAILFGEIPRLFEASLGLIELSQPCMNEGSHHVTEHKQLGPSSPAVCFRRGASARSPA